MPALDKPQSYDPSLGKAALAEQEPLLRAIPAQEVASPNSDPVASALAALALVELVRKPVHATRFKLLPAELFDPQTSQRLEKSAWALWYAHLESQVASASSSAIKVSVDLAEEAQDLKSRLQRLTEYHLGDNPLVREELADIRLRTGYSDLASDLERYARLLDLYRAELELDPKLYRKGDAELARTLAQRILESLRDALGTKTSLTDLRNRAWTLVNRDYAELVEVGQFVHRHQPELRALFVPLRAFLHPKQRTPRAPTEPPAPDGSTPDAPTS